MSNQASSSLWSMLILLYARILAGLYLVGLIGWCVLADRLRDLSGTPLGADFINVYAAGVMALRGQAAQVYDWTLHGQVEQAVAGYAAPYFGWHYPPMFMILACLLALMPYLWALALYLGGGLAFYAVTILPLAPRSREYIWALVAFPGVFVNIINGQNGFITTALFAAGMARFEASPWAAGLLLGLLAYKPQFFVLIPLMLAMGGYGRAAFMTVLTAFFSVALSWVTFGTAAWQAFFGSMRLTQHVVLEQGATGWQKIQSVFSLARMWGAGVPAAYGAQALVAVIAIGCCGYIWRRKKNLAVRVSALCAAMLLSTPYLLDYDLVILAVPIAMLAKEGSEKWFSPYQRPLLATLWLLPFFARTLGSHHLLLTPFVVAAMLWECLVRPKRDALGPV